jgi:hypothetical protein
LSNIKGIWERKCPRCDILLVYTYIANYRYAVKHNCICRKCHNQNQTGTKISDAVRQKLSDAKKGKPLSDEHKKSLSLALKGRKMSKESIERTRQWNIGKRLSEETKKKLSEARKGKKFTEEHKRHISESLKGRKISDEQRLKSQVATKEAMRKPEIRLKLRLAKIRHLNRCLSNGGQATPVYNPDACKIIEEYGRMNGYHFQHAENGGEYFIRELGYWLDGYDSNNNIAIEIDEKKHFDSHGKLREKDRVRQEEIENLLHCTFIRIKFDDFKNG